MSSRLYIQNTLEQCDRRICPSLVATFKSNRKTSTGCLGVTLATTHRERDNSLWFTSPSTTACGRIPEHWQKQYAEKYLRWAKCFFSKFIEPNIVSFHGKTWLLVWLNFTRNGVHETVKRENPYRHASMYVFTFDSLIKAFSKPCLGLRAKRVCAFQVENTCSLFEDD